MLAFFFFLFFYNVFFLKDELFTLMKEVEQPEVRDSRLTKKIRSLENRLDKAMIKFNEAQSIRRTYEQIVHRLAVRLGY